VLSLATERGGGQIITVGRIASFLLTIPKYTYPPAIRKSLSGYILDTDCSWKSPSEADQKEKSDLLVREVPVQPKKRLMFQ
jgi:hypothetical protein